MKKQINPTLKAHLIRSAFYLLLLLAVCAIPFAVAQRNKPKASRQNTQSQEALGPSLPLKFPARRNAQEKFAPVRMAPEGIILGPVSFQSFEYPSRVLRSLFPSVNALINNNNGVFNCNGFTQSETSVVSFLSTIVVGFNDSGSYENGGTLTNHFTGWSRSTDSGATWTDGGRLPASAGGDLGDPVLARDNTSGTIYFATLGFSTENVIQVFRSTNNGATWLTPVNGAPGKTGMQDKDWITVDNFSGSGNGNIYLVERDFGAGDGIYFFRSTDGGATFAPSGGTEIVSSMQGAFVTVRPDHSIHVWWYDFDAASIKAAKSAGVPKRLVGAKRPVG